MNDCADLELTLQRNGSDLRAELRFTPAGSSAPVTLLAGDAPLVPLDEAALRELALDPIGYGEQLSAMLWADERLAQAVAQARALAEGAGTALRLRLALDEGEPALHGLHWETLADPTNPNRPLLAVSERLRFSRFLGSSDLQALRPRPRDNRKALVVIANPEDLDAYQLDLIDGEAELARARAALAGVPIAVLAGSNNGGPATLNNIMQALRDGPDILYLVAHGSLHRGAPYLWLEDDEGLAARVSAKALVEQIQSLSQRPLLVVLASCQSAGNGATVGALNALGPQLAAAGIAAVVAMQGNVAQAAVSRFIPVFFAELLRDGAADRAAAAGRAALVATEEWWQPVLWMRVTDGQLWFDSQAQTQPAAPVERPTNLPTYPTPLFGREGDLAALVGLFFQEHVRLVTLLGPGGIGKTRLAVAAGWELRDEFADGVFFADLTATAGPDQLLLALAALFQLKEEPERPLLETLIAALRSRQLLLILDTVEHLLAAAPILGKLIAGVPQLSLIITSRAALHISGEYEYLVDPLPTPDLQQLPLRGSERVANLASNPAIALFMERASAVKPGFTLNEANAHLIAKICAQLDGLPLAIELAAVRIKMLAPPALLARLGNRLGLLTGGARERAAHQQTLRDTIGWSYELLSAEEQRLFARLALFVGEASFATIEAVCGIVEPGLDLLDPLSSLVDKSLLRQSSSAEDEARFAMLATIREYASECFSKQPAEEQVLLQQTHATYYLEWAKTARRDIQRPQQKAVLQQFEREHDNLRAALRWAINAPDGPLAGGLGDALYAFWYLRGYYSEGRQWLAEVLALGPALPTSEHAQVAYGIGLLAMAQGQYGEAKQHYELALADYQTLGNQQRVLGALQNLGVVARRQGAYDEASAYYAESLTLARTVGGSDGLFTALMNLAAVLYDQGQHNAANAYLEEALGLAQASGRPRELAVATNNSGLVAFHNGELALAIERFNTSLALYREQHNQAGTAMALNNLGRASLKQHEPVEAALQLGESLRLRYSIGDVPGIAFSLESLAELAYHQGDFDRAAQLWGAAEALRSKLKAPLAPVERPAYEAARRAASEALGAAQFAAALAISAARTVDETVAYALGE
jgi:predicted ATPase